MAWNLNLGKVLHVILMMKKDKFKLFTTIKFIVHIKEQFYLSDMSINFLFFFVKFYYKLGKNIYILTWEMGPNN